MGKKEKKTHNMFHCDQTNVCWFKIGGINFGSPVHGGRGREVGLKFVIFGKYQKALMENYEKKTYNKYHLFY